MHNLAIEFPPRIAALPREERGIPIPYFVKYFNGKPDLRVADPKKQMLCATKRVCWVCGQPLSYVSAFIGGPISCLQSLAFSDGPMHRECAEFSLKYCPYLAIPASKYRDANLPAGTELPTGAVEEKPDKFGMVLTANYRSAIYGNGLIFVAHNVQELTWWKEGKQL